MNILHLAFIAGSLIYTGPNNYKNTLPNNVEISALKQTDQHSINNALIELSEGINPKAFTKAWKTNASAWTEKVQSAADVPALSASYLSLLENIKPKFFKPSWEKGKDKWVKQVKEARSNLALAGLLKSFYSNLTPEAFTKDWPTKAPHWVESLGKIE